MVNIDQRRKLATGGGLLAIVLWSGTFALARSLSEKVGSLSGGAAVYLIGAVLCLCWLLGKQEWAGFHRLSLRYLAGCGSLFALYTVVIYASVGLAANHPQLLEVALLNYLWPTLTVLLSLWVRKRAPHPLLWPATALALVGVFLVMTQGAQLSLTSFLDHVRSNPAAYGLAVVGAFAWAAYSNLAWFWSGENTTGAMVVFMLASGVALWVLQHFFGEATRWSGPAVLEALALGAITATAYALWDAAMRKGNLPLVAVCSYFTPLLSTLVSCLYLGVKPGTKLWVGCSLLVAGSIASWLALEHWGRKPAGEQPGREPPGS